MGSLDPGHFLKSDGQSEHQSQTVVQLRKYFQAVFFLDSSSAKGVSSCGDKIREVMAAVSGYHTQGRKDTSHSLSVKTWLVVFKLLLGKFAAMAIFFFFFFFFCAGKNCIV